MARKVRAFLEQYWVAKHQSWGWFYTRPSEWMCHFSAPFLATVLTEETGEQWNARGGEPRGDNLPGGMQDTNGKWQSHYWVQIGGRSKNGRIIDITADQFGYDAPVIVTGARDPRYHANYSRAEVRAHLDAVRITVGKWLDGYRTCISH